MQTCSNQFDSEQGYQMWERHSFSVSLASRDPEIYRTDISAAGEMDDGLVLNIAEDASTRPTKLVSKKSGRWTDR
jgi:hypothetical protein